MGITDFLLLSCLGFAITAHAQDCARPVRGSNMHLKDEYILKETFADGERAAFECDTGYISAGGSSSITCTAGTWSAVMLKCERRNCGSPGEVPNGRIDYPKENLFGDHIEITCDEGYRLVGKSTITCGAAGWLNRLPRCEVVTCDEAPQVKDATIPPYKESYKYGEVVQYRCQNGLILNGSASLECSDDGTFKPDPPTCTRVQCEDLDLPHLDWISGSRPPHRYGATVTYKCRKGYKMAVGQPTLTCDINSEWSPGLPRCDMVTCNRPNLVVNGSFSPTKDVYNYGEVVQYSCQTGSRLSGSNSPSCSDDGTFKPAPPTCIMVTCNRPPVVANRIISPVKEVYKYKDVAQYSCERGFKLSGSNSTSCSADGTFKPAPPTCTMITCNRPLRLEHASFSPYKDSYKYGDVVEFSCQSGFRLNGSKSISCSADGTFKSAPPTCIMITCNRPLPFEHGSFSPARDSYKYGDVVEFSCQTGFRLNGSKSISCSDDGTFKPAPPTCTMMTCNRPLPLEHGSFSPSKDVYKYGDFVQYSCQTGSRLSGSTSASCSDDGTFKPAPPTCHIIYCEKPHVQHGHLTHDARPPYRHNDKVTFECKSGYVMDGNSTLTCQAGRQWSPPPPKCTDKGNGGTVAGGVIGGVAAAGAAAGGAAIYKNKKKRDDEENGTDDEEKGSLQDGVCLKPSNGQTTEEKSAVMNTNEV